MELIIAGQSLSQDATGIERPTGQPAWQDLHALHPDQLQNASYGRSRRSPWEVQIPGRDHLFQVWRYRTLCQQVSQGSPCLP